VSVILSCSIFFFFTFIVYYSCEFWIDFVKKYSGTNDTNAFKGCFYFLPLYVQFFLLILYMHWLCSVSGNTLFFILLVWFEVQLNITVWSRYVLYLWFFFQLKVYTCISDAVLSQFIPTSTPKFRYYKDNIVSYALFEELAKKLYSLKKQVCTFKQIINVQIYSSN
jgi:hypothetical protein